MLLLLVDFHTHLWSRSHLRGEFVDGLKRVWGDEFSRKIVRATPEHHFAAERSVDKVIVFGLQAKKSGCMVPNDYVAEYVRSHPDRLIGFASVDPNEEGAEKELKRCIKKLGLRGLKLGPIYQHFDPTSSKGMRIFELAQELEIPVVIHQGTTFVRNAPLKYANPIQLEEVALRFPDLT